MLVSLLHLLVQDELQEVEKLDILVCLILRVGQSLALCLIPSIVVSPLREISRAILVAQVRILSVRHKPLFCLLKERLELGTRHHLFTFLMEDLVQIVDFEIVYLLIINLRKSIQLLSRLLSLGTLLGILQLRQRMEVGILRMDGEDADAAIWIRIGPSMGDGGVVDRQKLQNLLSSLCHQVDHTLEVTEVTDACALLASEREDRHECTG